MNRIILLTFLVLPLLAQSQVELKGIVKNGAEPVIWANVVLTRNEGGVAGGTLTKDDGSFELKVKEGTYKIRISYLGFATWEKELLLEKNTDLGLILLKESGDLLKEVAIRSQKHMVEYKPDRLVFNVENSLLATGGNAVEALRAAPGVIVQNNSISMLGKGASHVMINGSLIELTGDDLINYLNAIAASDIAKVEVITSPPAKYEASGAGGLINIILKKGAKDSWKNSASLTYDKTKYGFYALKNNFLYNKNKLRLFAGLGAVKGNLKTTENLKTFYPDGLWEMESEGKQKQDNLSANITFDYDVSAHTSVGFQYQGNHNNPDRKDLTKIKIMNPDNQMDSLLVNTGLNDLSTSTHAYNVHMISKLDTMNRKISFDIDYFIFDSKTDNDFIAETFAPDMEFLNRVQAAKNVSDQRIHNISTKVDMEHPLRFMNLSYGAKVSSSQSKGDLFYYNKMSGNEVFDPARSNGFDYKENNQAIYVNGIKEMSSRMSMQLGLRIENTQTTAYSRTLNQKNLNSYLKLFPTFYLSYKANANHTFLFNYGRRINRPGFRNLNPFRSYINSNSYSEGNPFLRPSFNDNFDFTHVYKGKLRTNVFFNITNDGFGILFTSDPKTNTQIVSRQNYFKEYYYGIGENYTANIASWWQNQSSIYYLRSKSVLVNTIDAQPKNGGQVYFSTNNSFSLSASSKLQADYFYGSSFQRGIYEVGSMSGLNLAFKQSFVRNTVQLTLLANDVFNTSHLKKYASVVNGINQVYGQNNSNRFFRISLSYHFGNSGVQVKNRNFGNDDERKRTE